jgi:hypothetical protein
MLDDSPYQNFLRHTLDNGPRYPMKPELKQGKLTKKPVCILWVNQ